MGCRGRTAGRGPAPRATGGRAGCRARPARSRSGARPGGSGRWRRASADRAASRARRTARGPASWASRAVIRLPERSAASTTTTPSDRPAMMRLRRGKWRACGAVPSGASVTTAPASAIRALQIGVLGRVGHVEAAGHRRDGARRSAARPYAPRRRCRGRGRRPPPAECARFGGQVLGHALAVGRGVAAADQGDRAVRQQRGLAQHGEHGGRVVQQGQQRRIVGLAEQRSCGAPSRPTRVRVRARHRRGDGNGRRRRRGRRRGRGRAARRARPRPSRSAPAGDDR